VGTCETGASPERPRFVLGPPRLWQPQDAASYVRETHLPVVAGSTCALLRPDLPNPQNGMNSLLTKRSLRTAYSEDPALTAVRTACASGPSTPSHCLWNPPANPWLLHHVRVVGWHLFVDPMPRNDPRIPTALSFYMPSSVSLMFPFSFLSISKGGYQQNSVE
jgi:hypothetical protein